jgi:hypothetical protein
MARLVVLIFVLAFLAGCASEEPLSSTDHEPVPGETTPTPQPGARGGWSW